MKKVIIATGGTGGHIYPAVAFAQILKKQHPECEIVFFGSDDRMEKDLIPELGYRFIGMHMHGMNGNMINKISSAYSLLVAENKCYTLLKKENVDACIGFGNYISVPLILAAKRLNIPTMIHEQNSFAGKANKLLGKYVDKVAVSLEGSLKEFPSSKTVLTGNPESTIASEKIFDKTLLKNYGLDINKEYIFFMMGSLGSSSVSQVIDEAVNDINENYEVLIAKGKANDYEYKCSSKRIHIVDYVDGLTSLKFCKLAILRAGATTISEITALKTASILIPSPYVPHNHQEYNALELVRNNGAILLREKDLNKESLVQTINNLLKDEKKINELSENVAKMSYNNAAYAMVAMLEELQCKKS